MKKILFDASSHLAQFTLMDEQARIASKNLHVAMEKDKGFQGAWTDLDNGRVDRTIWTLERDLQDQYYPFMDRFFSLGSVSQEAFTDEESFAQGLSNEISLSFYSRMALSAAVKQQIKQVVTLYDEILSEEVSGMMRADYGLDIAKPLNGVEEFFADPELEECYQVALEAFRKSRVEILCVLQKTDRRMITL